MAAEWRPCGGRLVAQRQPLAVFFSSAEVEEKRGRDRSRDRVAWGESWAARGGRLEAVLWLFLAGDEFE